MSLPPELDFDRDREASPARMNRAMEYIFLRLAAATALKPEFRSAIDQLQAVGLERLNEALAPIFLDAQSIAGELDAIRQSWLTGAPLAGLLDGLAADVTATLAGVDADVAAQLAAQQATLTGQLTAHDVSVAAAIAAGNAATAQQLADSAAAYAAQLAIANAALNNYATALAALPSRAERAFLNGGF